MVRIVKWRSQLALIVEASLAVITCAQSPTTTSSMAQETQARGYWVDPSTGLMWAAKDNGKDVNWNGAVKYCRKLRLAGYPDWGLPTIAELERIYDPGVNTVGRAGQGKGRDFIWHVKGDLFLTGDEWSTTQRMDDRGRPNGLAWYFDFNEGIRNDDDAGRFTGHFASYGRRALCVRRSVD
jgi:hypothetical protein